MKFTHLHVHSHYSLLDGLPKIPELLDETKKLDMEAVALTDHGALYGALEFYKQAKRTGVKPIIGIEAYVALGDAKSEKTKTTADYYHLILLARDIAGYKNLMELVTKSHLEGFYYRPRMDKRLLREHSAGLTALSACLRGEIPRLILGGDMDKAAAAAREYQNIFGKENFFLEIQKNSQNLELQTVNEGLIKLARSADLPIVATNDTHYLKKEDKSAQDVLVCIGTGNTVNDQNRLDMREADLHLPSVEEMTKTFTDLPEALENTNRIAESVDLALPTGKRFFPGFEPPENKNSEDYLEELCWKGIATHYDIHAITSPEDIKTKLPPEVRTRMEYEIKIIREKGYATYFLVVADFVNWSRSRGIISTTRGSAAGSLAAYALGITTMNPLEYKLPFERFLNPFRPTPPDIDMDFADNRRDEVLQYVSEKYGYNKVAQIVTFGTMMARAAVRDVGRALGVPYSKVDRIAKMIPFGKQGFHMTIEKALALSPDLKNAYGKDQETANLIELAKKLEGVARHASVHAAGVVISPTKLTDYTPLQLDTDNKNVITQYDMHSVEDAGLVKMDFLGIRNLSILGNAVDIVKESRGFDINLQNIPLDDQKTFELLSAGRTMGVFQLGGSGMTKYLVDLKPSNIFDIMAMISLYRPGPMESIPEFIKRKHDPKLITYLDPRMKDILDLSYGVITYQDDVLLIAIKLAGYTWEEADKLRKAMGKKILKEMAAQKEKFIQGAIDNGMSSDKAVKLWSLIEPFAAYGFNKAHAASYAMVAYQTAYMKANYPVEFMAAVMTAESADNDKIAEAVSECTNLGIEVLPPDVNESLANFTAINEKQIRFGLSAIKNLGSDVINTIIESREETGPFVALADFAKRAKTRNFNKKSWEALVKSGSLDRFAERNEMLENTESVLEFARTHQKLAAAGQTMLFAGGNGSDEELVLKKTQPAAEQEQLSWEKEFLGLYVSAHPLTNHKHTLDRFCTPIKSIDISQENEYKTIGGIVTRVQNIITKKGDQMCFADIEDMTGKLELVVFPNVFADSRELMQTDKIILVRGKISDKDGDIKLLADAIKSIDAEDLESWTNKAATVSPLVSRSEIGGEGEGVKPKLLKIRIPSSADPEIFNKLKIVFGEFPGESPVSLVIPDREGTSREVKTNFTVSGSPEFKTKLKELLRESIKQKQ